MCIAVTIRVYLADDHPIFREGIRSLLQKASDIQIVGESGSGEETVRMVKELMPDVVLMDITMPGITGLEATARIRQFAPQMKVLILTMHETDQYVAQMLQVKASGYVVKSASASDLLSAIRAVNQGDIYLYPSIARMVVRDYLAEIGFKDKNSSDSLTVREIEILRYIADDLKNKQIADLMHISIRTVQAHRTNLMEKLGLHDRTELVKYAIRKGLISP
jgi:two-component system response regulator NreC